MFKTINLIFLCIILTTYYHEIEGDCCLNWFSYKYDCGKQEGECSIQLCLDGTPRKEFGSCGLGKGGCNIFGCNCDLGCREGTEKTAIAYFTKFYPDYHYTES